MQAIGADISIWEVCGLCGAMLYAFSYLLAAFDRLPSQSPLYYLSKLVAAVLVMISLIHSFNLASVVIQLFFIAISVIGICRHLDARRRARARVRSYHAVGTAAGSQAGRVTGRGAGCDLSACIIQMMDACPPDRRVSEPKDRHRLQGVRIP